MAKRRKGPALAPGECRVVNNGRTKRSIKLCRLQTCKTTKNGRRLCHTFKALGS